MKLKTLINEQELQKRIAELGEQITNDYENKEIVIICVLRGAAYFAIDLSKHINSNSLLMEFIQVSSYGKNKETTGELTIKKDL